jgi:hypothetical protein
MNTKEIGKELGNTLKAAHGAAGNSKVKKIVTDIMEEVSSTLLDTKKTQTMGQLHVRQAEIMAAIKEAVDAFTEK